MNLLMINYEYPPLGGGAANATYHIAKSLAGRGHGITVLTSGFKTNYGWFHDGQIRVYRCFSARRHLWDSNLLEMAVFTFNAGLRLVFFLKKVRFAGAIVFFAFPCGPLGYSAFRLSSVPYVISLRGGDVPGNEKALRPFHVVLKPFRRHMFKHSLRIVAPSEGLRGLAEKADPIQVDVVPNGVDTRFFCPASQKKDRPFRFLFVGRFQAQKNLDFLLEQLAWLHRETKKDFVLHMVGEGALKKHLKQKSFQLGLGERVLWDGWLNGSDLCKMYQQSHCLLNFSLYEGMPNVILESMASALPAIASDVAGNRDLIENGKTGLLCRLDNAHDFQRALQRLLNSPQEARMLGKNARDLALSSFSWDCVAAKYENYFTDKYG
jgi:glycosyltransferase involved in cell wall biosynthesis